MVNIATLNYLPELQQYEAQIPRLEDGWWPTGGAVNPAADSGLMNWQASLLANRTAFLKKVIDDTGLGAAAVPLVTLNSAAARLTGSYRFASGDANTPAAGVAGTVEVIAASASAVNQTAFDSATTRMWTRFWNGSVWSAWSAIARMTGTSRSIGMNGWQMFPREGTENPLILQWGVMTNAGGAGSTTFVAFPVTFPTACLQAFNTARAVTTVTAVAWVDDMPAPSGFNSRANIPNMTSQWWAIGH
jgi:hypothetical protein